MARRKPIHCPGCGELTFSDICKSCLSDLKIMREIHSKVDSGELVSVVFDAYLSAREYNSDRKLNNSNYSDIEREISKRILSISKAVVSKEYVYTVSGREFIASGSSRPESGLIEIYLPRDTAENVTGLMKDITNLVGIAYRSGYKDGANLLARLRDGQITISDFNERLERGTIYK